MKIIKIDNQKVIINENDDILEELLIWGCKIHTIIINLNNVVVYSSDSINEVFDANIQNKKLIEFLGEDDYKNIRKTILECIFTNKIIKRRLNFKNEEYNFKFEPISEENDKINLILINFYVATESNKLEEEIKLMKDKLNNCSVIKSIFLSNISHELKTPMNSIIGFSDLLLKTNQGEKQTYKFLKSINVNGKHLYELLSNIIDASLLESEDDFDILYEKFLVSELFEELFDIFDDINYKKNLDFVKLKFEYVKDEKITSDYLRLKRVLYNIISNSIKYTDSGHIDILFDIVDNDMLFKISDTGIGIKKDKIKYIFEKFWQTDSSTTKNYRGAGLGLYISKEIVELLNGKIWVESEVNKGTTITVKLPLEKKSEIKTSSNKNKISFSGKTALVIDELPINYSLLGMYLNSLNIDILSTSNIKDAIKILKTKKDYIDIIFLDLNLPIKESINLIKKLEKIKKCILISKPSGYIENLDYVLKKPLSRDNLLSTLNKIWQK
jgi:signal transduction histidine kinase/CheY-like chemotaxis protein